MSEAVVNEQLVQGLLGNRRVTSEFPFLAAMSRRTAPPPRSCCGRGARQHVDLGAIKLAIFGMGPQDHIRLKSIIGVEKLVFYLPGKAGVVKIER